MRKKTYFGNLNKAIIDNNRCAVAYRDAKAWDNKMRKTMKSHMPRGKCYRRLVDMEWKNTYTLMRAQMVMVQAECTDAFI